MKIKFLLLPLAFLLLTFNLIADEGDTLIIQTIEWDTPTLPGWNSPRSGTYQFPGDTISFSKILMLYTLKCDPSQNPACGEWDYLTYTHIREHTGVYDSTLYFHDNYMVNNASPDSFMLMDDVSWSYNSWMEYSNQTEPTAISEVGDAGEVLIFHDIYSAPDGRLQHIYKAEELIAGGVQPGEITGIRYLFGTGDLNFSHFTLRMKNVEEDTLLPNQFISEGLTTVVHRNLSFETGIEQIGFAFPFNWDGTSNILVDISYSDYSGSAEMVADPATAKTSKFATLDDNFLNFEGWDYIDVPAEVFETIDSAITISFWQYGNPAVQPANSSILEGMDAEGHRVLNIHLPWGNEVVYWDAGWNGGNDRLELAAGDHSNYKGQWNHWTFTKNIATGLMLVYLNGELWNIGGGYYRSMAGITDFRIGASLTYTSYYHGMIDEVQIWDTELSAENIKAWMYRNVNSTHPDYENLRAYYQFNEGDGFGTEDSSPNGFDGQQFGYPEWLSYNGSERFKASLGLNVRPHIILENGVYDSLELDSIVRVDTSAKAPVSIVLYDPADPPLPMDTLTKWPHYYNDYVFNETGLAIDSTLVTPDSMIYHEDLPYYGEPYEQIIPWEIARYITPYGINLSLGDGWTWVFDVTDYAPMLRDSVHLTAGNFQELLDLKFMMIEGTPPREVKKIEKIYSGSFALNTFEETIVPDTIALQDDATTFKVKMRTSGHQFDNATNCAEFCEKIHYLDVEGQTVYDWQIIEECSNNPLYPQGGTWIYDRAGWCPGAKVTQHDVEITPYITGDTVILDYNSDPDPYGNYVLEVQLFSYGDPNFAVDAAVDDIIRPGQNELYGRFNPSAASPAIVIQNRGGDTLTSVDIIYGPAGSSKTLQWTGNLPFMEKVTIALETFEWENWTTGNGKFSVRLENPNGTTDENTMNDALSSSYTLPPVYDGTIVIHFKTNKFPEQNSYQVFNMEGEVVFERNDFEASTLHIDTVTLLNGIYDFHLWDSGDNGISFWADNEGSGSLKFYDLEGELIKTFQPDFGDDIYHNFYMDTFTGSDATTSEELFFEILPNPNDGRFALSYAMKQERELKISIFNTSGQNIWNTIEAGQKSGKVMVNLNVPSGVYTCIIESDGLRVSKRVVVR